MAKLIAQVDKMRFPGDTEDLISDLAFSVQSGEFVSLLGPSGAGKTTFLRILSGLERGFAGAVMLDGQSVRPSRRIQMLFQENRLIPWMTAAQNISLALPETDLAAKEKTSEVIRTLGLSHRSTAWPRQLSGGEQARVALGRSLVSAPDVLLLDEPFKSLDLQARVLAADLLKQMLTKTGMAVVMVSHDIGEAVALSDRILVLASRPLRIAQQFEIPIKGSTQRTDERLFEIEQSVVEAVQLAFSR